MQKRMLQNCAAFLTGMGVAMVLKRKRKIQDKAVDKYFLYYNLLNKWMKQKEKGISVTEKLHQWGIKEVAIYGMGDIARHLQWELADTDVRIKYAIDQSELSVIDIDTYLPNSELPQVDAVIVTPILDYENISAFLRQKMSASVICITELIEGMEGCTGENR